MIVSIPWDLVTSVAWKARIDSQSSSVICWLSILRDPVDRCFSEPLELELEFELELELELEKNEDPEDDDAEVNDEGFDRDTDALFLGNTGVFTYVGAPTWSASLDTRATTSGWTVYSNPLYIILSKSESEYCAVTEGVNG